MAGPTRPFHGLSGGEIRQMLVQEITREMAEHPDFGSDQPLRAGWQYEVVFEVGDPRTPQTFTVHGAGQDEAASGPLLRQALAGSLALALSRDQRLAQHLSFPRVSWDPRLRMDLTTPAVAPAPAPDRTAVLDARRTGTEAGMAIERERAPAGSEAIVTDAQGHRFRLVPLEGADRPPVAGPSRASQFRTGTGLEITGGAARPDMPVDVAVGSFGGGSMAGVVHEDAVKKSIELGVVHPRLADGGIKPDQARRDAGLPVPQPTRTKSGGIVDVPANSF